MIYTANGNRLTLEKSTKLVYVCHDLRLRQGIRESEIEELAVLRVSLFPGIRRALEALHNALYTAAAATTTTTTTTTATAMHDTLHWLSFPQHVTFKLCLLTYKCLHGLAPDYLSRFCTLLTSVPGCPRLHSADANKLLVPRSCTASFGLPSVLLIRLPGTTCRLICATWTYI